MTQAAENTRIIEEATAWNHGRSPDIVWANAGAAAPDLFTDTSVDTLRAQMDINYWAASYLAHATLTSWLKTTPSSASSTSSSDISAVSGSDRPRHFIVTSSTIAFVGLAGYATYAPAKAALRSLADSLRSEMGLYNGARRSKDAAVVATAPDRDISVHIVLPGTILSPGLERENLTKHPVTVILEDGDPRQSEDEVAAAALRGLERGEFMVTTQMLGSVMKAGMLGGSPRARLVVDTLLSWVASIAWLFVGPDLDGKVWKYGTQYGSGRRPAKA